LSYWSNKKASRRREEIRRPKNRAKRVQTGGVVLLPVLVVLVLVQKKLRQASKRVAKASKESASMQEDAPAWAKQLFDSQAKRMGKLEKQLAALRTTGVRLMLIKLSSGNESNSKVGNEGDALVIPRDADLGLDLGLDKDYVFF
jgi:hypothetical protein